MDALAAQVATRYAARRSYRVDRSAVLRKLRNTNNPRTIEDSKKAHGGYTQVRFEFVPIEKIQARPVWNAWRANKIRQGIKDGKALPPIDLSADLGINDGIHRYNVSKEKGFTHIPALISKWIDTPDEMETPEPEKKQLHLGEWVKLREPDHGRSYGWIEELIHHRYDKGVKRWMYNVALVKHGDTHSDDIDISDTEFDPEKRPPSWAVKLRASLV